MLQTVIQPATEPKTRGFKNWGQQAVLFELPLSVVPLRRHLKSLSLLRVKTEILQLPDYLCNQQPVELPSCDNPE